MCVHGRMYTWACVYMGVCVHGRVYMGVCVCTWACINVCTCACVSVCTWDCVLVCVHERMSVYIGVFKYTYMSVGNMHIGAYKCIYKNVCEWIRPCKSICTWTRVSVCAYAAAPKGKEKRSTSESEAKVNQTGDLRPLNPKLHLANKRDMTAINFPGYFRGDMRPRQVILFPLLWQKFKV